MATSPAPQHRCFAARDTRLVSVAAPNTLHVFALGTAELAAVVQVARADGRVQCVVSHPRYAQQVLVGTDKGRVRAYDVNTGDAASGVLARVPGAIARMVARGQRLFVSVDAPCDPPVFASSVPMTRGAVSIYRVALETAGSDDTHEEAIEVGVCHGLVDYDVSHDARALVYITLTTLVLQSLDAGRADVTLGLALASPPTQVRCSPRSDIVATGDTSGPVMLRMGLLERLHGITQPQTLASTEVKAKQLAWHAHAVRTLQFSADGHHVLSGGAKGVLMSWQHGADEQRFFAHLGAALCEITESSDGTFVALTTQAGDVRVLDVAANEVVFSAVAPHSDAPAARPLLAMDPKTQLAVTQGRPGMLRMLDVAHGVLVSEFEVQPYNHVPDDHDTVGRPVVDHVGLTRDGAWMVTLDHYTPGSARCLKLWRRDVVDKGFVLSAQVNEVHGEHGAGLAMHPSALCAVTFGMDGLVRVWMMNDKATWRCVSKFGYREQGCLSAAMSHDGSVLAVGHAGCVSVWAEVTTAPRLAGVLPVSLRQDAVKQLAFMGSGLFLAGRSERHVWMWSMTGMSELWRSPVASGAMVVADETVVVAVSRGAQGDGLLTLLPTTPVPSAVQPLEDGEVAGLATTRDGRVVVLTRDGRVWMAGATAERVVPVKPARKQALWAPGQAQGARQDQPRPQAQAQAQDGAARMALAAVASHVLPTTAHLFARLVEQTLQKR